MENRNDLVYPPVSVETQMIRLPSGQTYDHGYWSKMVDVTKPGGGLFLTELPIDWCNIIDTRYEVGLAVKHMLATECLPEINRFNTKAWFQVKLLKLSMLVNEYVKNGYRFMFPYGAHRHQHKFTVHPGVDRAGVVKLFGMEETLTCVYQDLSGEYPLSVPHTRIEHPDQLLGLYPQCQQLDLLLRMKDEHYMLDVAFDDGTWWDRWMDYAPIHALIRSHSRMPVRINPERREEILTSLEADGWLAMSGLAPMEITSPEERGEARYWLDLHRPIRPDQTWLLALLWLLPTHRVYRGECLTLHVPEGEDRVYDLPPVF